MTYPEIIQSKIYNRESILPKLYMWRFLGKKIVFTNGCFDIIHAGHIDYLSKAAQLGNLLIVGLNTDSSVSRLKGPGRPLQDMQSREMIMASLFFVNAVVAFEEDTPYELIKLIQPDVLVKGSDYKEENIIGADVVKAKNGVVVTIPFLEGHSTSGIEEKILRNKQIKQ